MDRGCGEAQPLRSALPGTPIPTKTRHPIHHYVGWPSVGFKLFKVILSKILEKNPMRSPFTRPVTCRLPNVALQPSVPRRSAAKAGPTQSSPVQVSPTESNLCEADCESDVRPTCNQEPVTCNLPPSAASVSLWPKICVSSVLRGRRSALWLQPSQTQSNPVKPWELEWGGDSLSPQHPPPPPPGPDLPPCGDGPRLWQRPAAALRPARHPNPNEDFHHAIVRPSFSFVIQLAGRASALSYLKLF